VADDLDLVAGEVSVLAQAMVQGDDTAVVRGLTVLRDGARGRREAWGRQLGQARAAHVDGADTLSPDAVAEAGVAHRDEAWIALDQDDRATARRHFLEALWADSEDADAWLGYGLSAPSRTEAIGAIAVALLKYPDVTTARVRRDSFVALAAHGDANRQRVFDDVFAVAVPFTERQRTRLPADLVRLGEPFSWGAQ
jgi:hypothetical protein